MPLLGRTFLMGAVQTIGLLSLDLSSRTDCICELFEDASCGVPVDACVSDGNTLLQRSETASCRNLLIAFIDVGFDHDANDAVLAFAELVADRLRNLGLVAVVFQRVAWIVKSATSTFVILPF